MKNGDLPADYGKEKFQETFRREIRCDFLETEEKTMRKSGGPFLPGRAFYPVR